MSKNEVYSSKTDISASRYSGSVNSKMLVVLVAVAAVVGALIYWFGAYPTNQPLPLIEKNEQVSDQSQNAGNFSEQQFSSPEKVPLPKANGSIDGTVDALEKGAVADQVSVSSEDNDSSLLNSDSKEVTDFGQSYNEKDIQ